MDVYGIYLYLYYSLVWVMNFKSTHTYNVGPLVISCLYPHLIIIITTINPAYCSYFAQLSYQTGAPHSRSVGSKFSQKRLHTEPSAPAEFQGQVLLLLAGDHLHVSWQSQTRQSQGGRHSHYGPI